MKSKLNLSLPGGIQPLIYGVAITYLLVATLSLISGLVFYFTPLSEMWMYPVGAGITTLALFFGGRTAAKKAGNKGLLNGLVIGIIFIVITVLFSFSKDISWSSLGLKSTYALLAAIIGGISGVK